MNPMLWFSPVPPARTDIAQYSARVVPHVASLVDLRVIRPDDGEAACPQDQRIPTSDPAGGLTVRDLNACSLSLYNIGNNPAFHAQILRIGMRHPGIVILHDRSLQDLCHAVLDDPQEDEEDSAGSYQAAMGHWYGRAGKEAARAAMMGDISPADLAQEFPLFEVVLRNALGVVTHNPEVADEIADRFPGLPVASLHLPYGPAAPRTRSLPALSADRPIRLVMFGYLNANRRLSEFLRAWAQSPWRERFELDLAGEMGNGPEAAALMGELGLTAQIRSHGFLPDDRLDALIGEAHLALNLRNPTMGEASGSQLRIWANGTASVISDTGWYSHLPHGAALRISTQNEHADLIALLDDLAGGRIDLAAVARAGEACLGASDPATYAATLVDWLASSQERMFAQWTETALIEATARTYASCTPARFIPRMPDRLTA